MVAHVDAAQNLIFIKVIKENIMEDNDTTSNNNLVKKKEDKLFLDIKNRKGMYLNLFCGARILPGFLNIDSDFQDNHVFNYDVRNLPFHNSVIDAIYCSLVNDSATSIFLTNSFREWYRVLKPNLKFYLKIPDLENIIFQIMSPETKERRRKLLLFILYGQEIAKFPEDNLGYLLNPTLLSQRGFYREDLTSILKMYGFKDISLIQYEEFGNPFLWVEAKKGEL